MIGPESPRAFDYGRTERESQFADALLALCEERGIPASADELLVTAGACRASTSTRSCWSIPVIPELVARAGRTPRLVYVIPNFQNPCGTTLSLGRRQRLVELVGEWGAVVLEDDAYGMLRFEGVSLPGLRELSERAPNVISVHTLSKILALTPSRLSACPRRSSPG